MEIITKVKVRFHIPGIGVEIQNYALDSLSDMQTWALNESCTVLVTTGIKIWEKRTVSLEEYDQIIQARKAMEPAIAEEVAKWRKKAGDK